MYNFLPSYFVYCKVVSIVVCKDGRGWGFFFLHHMFPVDPGFYLIRWVCMSVVLHVEDWYWWSWLGYKLSCIYLLNVVREYWLKSMARGTNLGDERN